MQRTYIYSNIDNIEVVVMVSYFTGSDVPVLVIIGDV